MSTPFVANPSRTLCARTALSVLSAALVLGASGSAVAQDQPWGKAPPRRPPAAQPQKPAKPAPKPKPAPKKEAPPAEEAPAEAEPAPSDEAAPPQEDAGKAAPGPEQAPPAEAPAAPAEQPAADEAPPAEVDPQALPTEPAETAPADEPTEVADEPAAEPEAADEPATGCPTAAAPAHPRPPARPAGPPVPPLATGPDELEWVEGAAIPPGYEPDTRVRKGLLIGGLVTFGVAWLGSAAAASYLIEEERYGDRTFQVGDDDGEEYPAAAALYVPVVGPFVAIGTMDPNKRITAALVADGVVQVGGVAMALAGLVFQEKVLVRSNAASVTVAPTVGTRGAGGLSVSGSF